MKQVDGKAYLAEQYPSLTPPQIEELVKKWCRTSYDRATDIGKARGVFSKGAWLAGASYRVIARVIGTTHTRVYNSCVELGPPVERAAKRLGYSEITQPVLENIWMNLLADGGLHEVEPMALAIYIKGKAEGK